MQHLAIVGLAVAMVLALALLGNHLAGRVIDRRHPPIGRFIQVDGVRLPYVERGAGPPVVLLHGNGAMIADFAASGLIGLLAGRYHVIVFDQPGFFGHSSRPRGRDPGWPGTSAGHTVHYLVPETVAAAIDKVSTFAGNVPT